MSDLRDHRLVFSPDIIIDGKVFVSRALDTTGAEMPFQHLAPEEGSAFLHSHKTHEEFYIIKGDGKYQIDGEIFPILEGSIVRVASDAKRALKNTGEIEIIICVQYKVNSFGAEDAHDGIMFNGKIKSITLSKLT